MARFTYTCAQRTHHPYLIKRFLVLNAQALSLPHSPGRDILLLKSNLDFCDVKVREERLVCDLQLLKDFLEKEILQCNCVEWRQSI